MATDKDKAKKQNTTQKAEPSGASTNIAQPIRIVPEVCIRCGTCMAIYPEFFEMTPEGEVKVKSEAVIPDDKVEEIKSVCPSSAIQ